MGDAGNRNDERVHRRTSIALAVGGCTLLAIFSLIAAAVAPPTTPGRWDEGLHSALLDARESTPIIYRASALLTHVADRFVLITLAAAAAVVLAMQRGWRIAMLWLAVAWGGLLAGDGVKHLVGRARPPSDLTTVMSPSFPSGHALGAMLVGGMIAYMLTRSESRWGRVAAAAIVIGVIPVGLTRIVLGVHWLSDVFGGWLFGAGWALVGVAVLELFSTRVISTRPPTAPSNPATAQPR